MPSVSIVVPTYKRAQYLGRMIDSVVAQTYDDWELIIVDGRSNDGTAELIDSYRASLGDRLVFIEQHNQGCCVARNTGIDAARGEFVAFLDSDDEFLPEKLARQMELFALRPELGMVYGDYSYLDLSGAFVQSMFDTKSRVARQVPSEEVSPNLHVCAPDFFSFLLKEYFIATIVGVVRREVLGHDIRFLEHDLYGCEWLFYLESARRCRVGYVDEPLCMHHWVDGSLSRTSKIRNMVYHRRLLKTMHDRFPDMTRDQRRVIDQQLAETCRQLGFDSHKTAEFGPSVRYFREAFLTEPRSSTAAHLAQSACRWVIALGRSGTEPMLRIDPYRTHPSTAICSSLTTQQQDDHSLLE